MSETTAPRYAESRVRNPRSWWRDRWWQRARHHCLRPLIGTTGDSWECLECGEKWTYGTFIVYGDPAIGDRHDDGETLYEGWHQ